MFEISDYDINDEWIDLGFGNDIVINDENISEIYYEELSEEVFNSKEIKNFRADSRGKSIADYLKADSWSEQQEGMLKCFLIKLDDHVIGYFTLSSNAVYEKRSYEECYERLGEEDKILVDRMFRLLVKNNGDIDILDIFEGLLDNYDDLLEIVGAKYQIQLQLEEYKDTVSVTQDVYKLYPAISINYFCKNINYTYDIDSDKYKLGTYLFYEIIAKHILELEKYIGFKYITIYVADIDREIGSDSEREHLTEYYRKNLGFETASNTLVFLRSFNERGCEAMIQSLANLKRKKSEFDEYLHNQGEVL